MKLLVVALFAFAMIGAFALLAALPTMWLWNWLMPELFALKEVTFWQALGLNFLTTILFKGSSTTSSSKG